MAVAVAMAVLLMITTSASPATAKLTVDYYKQSCPNVQEIISQVVTTKQITSPTTAPGTLRLFFHDCFVGGCDASVLITSNSFNRAERDADINLSLPGDAFDVVVRAKTAVELTCPGVVSCADILTVATRDLVQMLGGPFFPVRLGRKDALASAASAVEGNLGRPNMSITQILSIFSDKGFTTQEAVALTGAHTVGFTHCKEYAERIFGYRGGRADGASVNVSPAFDPSMNPGYAQALQKACANYLKDPTIATFNDVMTPGKFDNMYFKNLQRGMVLLASDQAMLNDERTASFVALYADNQTAFFHDFAHAMEKLSVYGVKTGRHGEVRRRCDQFNNIST